MPHSSLSLSLSLASVVREPILFTIYRASKGFSYKYFPSYLRKSNSEDLSAKAQIYYFFHFDSIANEINLPLI